jgi:hypothetical protein
MEHVNFKNKRSLHDMQKNIILILLVFLLLNTSYAKELVTRGSRISILSEAISFPTYKLVQLPIHPGFSIGTNLLSKSKGNHEHAFSIEFMYFYQQLIGHSLVLIPEYQYNQRIWNILIGGDIGFGYMHCVFDRPTYIKKNGEWKQVVDWGTPQAVLPLGLTIGYFFPKNYEMYVQYRCIAEAPFNRNAGIFIMSKTTFHIGMDVPLYVNLFKRKSK